MMHMFDVDVAKQYGVNAAILLQYIFFWCEKNKANGKHLYDGYVWSYNSLSAFQELFPYLSVYQIRTALSKLEDDKLIIKGDYNKKGFDKTNWYAVTEAGYAALKNHKSMVKKPQIDDSKITNRSCENHKPIPVNNQLYKKINKKDSESEFEAEFEEFWNKYPNKFNRAQTYKNFVKTAKAYGADTALRALDIYLDYIRDNDVPEKYIARSTNFVGQKALFKAYLELAEQSKQKTAARADRDESEDIFLELAKEGGFIQ